MKLIDSQYITDKLTFDLLKIGLTLDQASSVLKWTETLPVHLDGENTSVKITKGLIEVDSRADKSKPSTIVTKVVDENLTEDIIDSYGFKSIGKRIGSRDYGKEYTLPCGLDVIGYNIMDGEVCTMNALEGLDGYLYIETKSDLDVIATLTPDNIGQFLLDRHSDMDNESHHKLRTYLINTGFLEYTVGNVY